MSSLGMAARRQRQNWVERIVAPILIVLAFVPLNGATQTARIFFGIMCLVILSVERLTAYRSVEFENQRPLDLSPLSIDSEN